MSILLYCDTATDATIATPARLGRMAHPPRHYQAQGHFLELSGYVGEQDADEICKIPGWRLATAQEQNQLVASRRKQSKLVEAAPPPDPAPTPEPAKSDEPTEAAAPAPAAEKDN